MGESLESNFNAPIKLDPILEKVSKDGIGIKNMVNVSGSNWTIGALTAWHFGLPLKVPLGGNEYYSNKGFLPNAVSIFDILQANGYKNVLLLGSDSNFSGMRNLFINHGNFQILDRKSWEDKGWSLKQYQGSGWGYKDAFTLQRAQEIFDELQKGNDPFVLIVETVDTHAPEGWCPEDKKVYNDIRDVYLETDRQIGKFVEYVKSHKDPSVVLGVIGDHLFMGEPEIFQGIKRRIRNVFWGDIPEIPKHKRKQMISAVDIAPTLLEAAGARWTSRKFGLGVSIFSIEPSLVQKISLSKYNKIVMSPSATYQSFY